MRKVQKLLVVGLLGGVAAVATANAMGSYDDRELAKGRAFGRDRTLVKPRADARESNYQPAPEYTEWLFKMMLLWTDLKLRETDPTQWEKFHHENVVSAIVRYVDIASDLAIACQLDGLLPKQALDLLAIAFEESDFDRLVDDGTCNSPGLLALMPDVHFTCDDGFAHSIWQIHDSTLTPDDRVHSAYRAAELYEKSGFDMWTTGRRAKAWSDRWWAKYPFYPEGA